MISLLVYITCCQLSVISTTKIGSHPGTKLRSLVSVDTKHFKVQSIQELFVAEFCNYHLEVTMKASGVLSELIFS